MCVHVWPTLQPCDHLKYVVSLLPFVISDWYERSVKAKVIKDIFQQLQILLNQSQFVFQSLTTLMNLSHSFNSKQLMQQMSQISLC